MRALLLAPLVMIAACDGGGEATQAPPARPITMANPYHDALMAAEQLPRFATIRAAIDRNGQPCRTVQGAAFQEDYRNMKVWVVRCAGTRTGSTYKYALFLAPDGNSQVRACANMAQLNAQDPSLGLPICREDLPPA